MLRAVRRALAIRARDGIEGVAGTADLDAAIRRAGLGLRQDRPYRGRVQGRLFRGTVCVRRGLWEGQVRVVKAHELGHFVLGHGEAFFLRPSLGGERPAASAECLAHVFAWTLLLGRPAATTAGLNAQIAEGYAAGLPLDFLFTGASILGYRTPAVKGTPLLALS